MGELMTGDNMALILGVLLGISEALSLIPSLKANGIFDFIYKILKMFGGKKDGKFYS